MQNFFFFKKTKLKLRLLVKNSILDKLVLKEYRENDEESFSLCVGYYFNLNS